MTTLARGRYAIRSRRFALEGPSAVRLRFNCQRTRDTRALQTHLSRHRLTIFGYTFPSERTGALDTRSHRAIACFMRTIRLRAHSGALVGPSGVAPKRSGGPEHMRRSRERRSPASQEWPGVYSAGRFPERTPDP